MAIAEAQRFILSTHKGNRPFQLEFNLVDALSELRRESKTDPWLRRQNR